MLASTNLWLFFDTQFKINAMKKVLILTVVAIFGGMYSVNAQERKAEPIKKESVKLDPQAKPVTIENRMGAEAKSAAVPAPAQRTEGSEKPKETIKKESAPKTDVKQAPESKAVSGAATPRKEAPKK